MKKCVIALMLILSCCMFFGCGQSIPMSKEFILLSLATTADGQVLQTLDFSVGSKKLKAGGVSESELLSFRKALTENVELFRQEFLINFAILYSANPNENFKLGKAVLLSGVTYDETSDSVGFDILFKQGAWDYYHPSSGEGASPDVEIGFVVKSTVSGQFPFAAEVKLSDGTMTTVGQRYIDAYLNALKVASIYEKGAASYNPDLVYNYATPSSHLRSDCDHNFQSENLYHHVWVRKMAESQDSVKLYTIDLHSGLWYLLILTVSLVGLGVAITVIKIKEKKRRK